MNSSRISLETNPMGYSRQGRELTSEERLWVLMHSVPSGHTKVYPSYWHQMKAFIKDGMDRAEGIRRHQECEVIW